ncbi:MAG: LytTR family transcriptional regulator [Candidatus Kapabacteria bacterium]|nr:LytTR family transcriptional regulator [Candidatus Kapabacteria bacterium]
MYLRVALVVAEEYRYVVESTIRVCAGDAIRIVSVCRTINEARIRSALVEPDVIVVGPGYFPHEIASLARPDFGVPPQIVVWISGDQQPLIGIEGLVGHIGPQTPREVIVGLFETCAQITSQRRVLRTTTMRHPEAVYRPDIIALPHQHGIDVRPTESIIHVKGEGNYTLVSFDKGGDIIMSRTIGDYEEVLPANTFLRVHRSHIINIHHVRRVIRGKVMRVVLSNGDEVEVADSKRDSLLGLINIVRRR